MARREICGMADESGRTCIVTRKKGPSEGMIRFVLGPDREVVPDIRRKLPGRGVWVSARADTVAQAVRQHAFARGFKTKVVASPSLAEEIDHLLTKDCLQALALANKAGEVITGFAKVEAVIEAGKLAALIHATDCGADGRQKLAACMRRHFGAERPRPSIDLFEGIQLDLALGRTNVVHAALIDGPASRGLLQRCQRLQLYRSPSPRGTGDFPARVGSWNETFCGLPERRRAETEWAGTQS